MAATCNPILVIATRNPGKAREFRLLLAGLPFRVLTLDDLGVRIEVEETGDTFAANAQLKAEGYHAATGELTLADDSGIEVDALNGRPGVHSARYVRPGQTDEEGRVRMLEEMAHVPGWSRRARYRAVIAVLGGLAGSQTHFFDGTCEGAIAHEPIGGGGFGYDPIFWVPAERRTMAELSASEKDAISHRGIATRKAVDYLRALP
ncbi:MAG: RdgB/HAM1 family non-canonical purine NTP pyrophosphatase [Dehalococcoidia bacterium]|nr:RdgB/HAM1 family non-canonical purine NTP pyrophosphatase [Dehalococcoidia bacterium]